MAHCGAATIAYYTVVEDQDTGWTGGLLVLNHMGRPVEFQCSLPVRPSRAHAILFGPTLREHLIGEVIGTLLVEKCRSPIALLCCDQPEGMKLGQTSPFPVVLVQSSTESHSVPDGGPLTAVPVAGAHLMTQLEDVDQVRRIACELADLPDAVEPLDRIREAIKEAHSQIARVPAASTHSMSDSSKNAA